MKYPIKSKEGDAIVTIDYGAIPLEGIRKILLSCTADDQIQLFNKLGINFHEDAITVSFKECGKAYQAPDEDQSLIDEVETEYSMILTFQTIVNRDKFPLKLSINLDECTDQLFVNFLGEICFLNFKNIQVRVPIIGRGTAALEGRINDSHSGLCTSGKNASFQERVAILSCILACFELSRDDIEIFRAHLLKVCNKYIGGEDMLSYTINKAFSLNDESYFEYMTNLYMDKDDEKIPLMLNHFFEFGEPHPLYFYELTIHLSKEEIEDQLKHISSNVHGPDKKPISLRVRNIINKFILFDGIYLIKPYPGNFHIKSHDKNLTIYDVANEFNANSLQRSLDVLEKIGVIVHNDIVHVTFTERGKKRFLNDGTINSSGKILDETFTLNLKRKSSNADSLLKLKIYLDIEPIDNLNFFGKIEIRQSIFRKLIVPLVGKGTISLEGSIKEKHKGFCIGRNFASFYQRVAIIHCSLILLDVDVNDLFLFETNIKSIHNQYHGKHKMIDYIFKVSKGNEESETFFQYMKKSNMDYSTMPIGLKTILTYNRLPTRYYEDVISKYTEEELIKEEQIFDKGNLLTIVPKIFHHARMFVQKINIF